MEEEISLCKKVVSLILVFILSLSTFVYGEELEVSFEGYDRESSTLEELAAKRLYVYGLIDNQMDQSVGIPMLFYDVNSPINRLEVADIFYRIFQSEKDNSDSLIEDCMFEDVPEEYKDAVSYLVDKELVSGISNEEFGISECDIDSFATILLRYLGIYDISYNEATNKLKEIGLLKCVTLENGFTKGDVYLIIYNLLDYEQNGISIKDNLVFKNKREEIRIPTTINISITSFEDFKEKLDIAYFFAPDKINIEILENCSERDVYLVYDFLLKDRYSWFGVFDNFYDISSVMPWSATGFSVTYSEYFKEHWRVSEDARAKKAVQLYDEIESLYKMGAFVGYGEVAERYKEYLQNLVHFYCTADKKQITISTDSFNESFYFKIDMLDWVKCYDNPIFIEKVKKCLSDMDEFKDLSDYDKVNKVHNYICSKASYDYRESNSMFSDSYDHRYADAHDVMGFVIDGLIVCDGYAYTYQWLLDYLGVDSIVVYGDSTLNGKSEGHAWNKVKIDGDWYNVDVCWSDTGCGREYFLKSDDYFKKHYHTFEDDFLLPNLRAESKYSK